MLVVKCESEHSIETAWYNGITQISSMVKTTWVLGLMVVLKRNTYVDHTWFDLSTLRDTHEPVLLRPMVCSRKLNTN